MEPLDGPPLRTRLDPTRLQGQRHLDPVDVRQRALEQHLMGSTPGLEPEDAVRGAPQSLRRLPVHEDPCRRPVARAPGERDGGLGRCVDLHSRAEGSGGDVETEARARGALRNALRPLEQALLQLAQQVRRREFRPRVARGAEDDEPEHERARGGRREASRAQRTRDAGEEEARQRDPQEGERAVHAGRGERQVEALIPLLREKRFTSSSQSPA